MKNHVVKISGENVASSEAAAAGRACNNAIKRRESKKMMVTGKRLAPCNTPVLSSAVDLLIHSLAPVRQTVGEQVRNTYSIKCTLVLQLLPCFCSLRRLFTQIGSFLINLMHVCIATHLMLLIPHLLSSHQTSSPDHLPLPASRDARTRGQGVSRPTSTRRSGIVIGERQKDDTFARDQDGDGGASFVSHQLGAGHICPFVRPDRQMIRDAVCALCVRHHLFSLCHDRCHAVVPFA